MYEFKISIKTKNGTITGQAQRQGQNEKQARMKLLKFYKSQIKKQIHKIKIEILTHE